MSKLVVLVLMSNFMATNSHALRPCNQTLLPRLCCEIFPNNVGCSERPLSASALATPSSHELQRFLKEPSLTSVEKKKILEKIKQKKH